MRSLFQTGSDSEAFEPPLSSDEIADAVRILARHLPSDLIELYHMCNGGQGALPYQPWNFILWGLEDVVQTAEDDHYKKYYGSYLFFGTSGGGEYFGMDQATQVFIMDPIAGEESIIVVAKSFQEFLANVGFEPPDGFPD